MEINMISGLNCVGGNPNEWLDHPSNAEHVVFDDEVINVINIKEAPVEVQEWLSDEYDGGAAFYGHCPESGRPVHLVFCDTSNPFVLYHEIGHVVLGHTKLLLEMALSGKSLTKGETLRQEFEADEYASRIVGVSQSMIALSIIFDENPNRTMQQMMQINHRVAYLSMLL